MLRIVWVIGLLAAGTVFGLAQTPQTYRFGESEPQDSICVVSPSAFADQHVACAARPGPAGSPCRCAGFADPGIRASSPIPDRATPMEPED